MAVKKVNITVPESLLNRIDDFTKETGISRSSLMSIATTHYLDSLQAAPAINQMLKTLADTLAGTQNGTLEDNIANKNISDVQDAYFQIYGKKP